MNYRFGLDGKVALVTGASSGLGRHFAKVLAEAGAKVVLAARRLDRLEALADEIRSNGGDALPVVLVGRLGLRGGSEGRPGLDLPGRGAPGLSGREASKPHLSRT